MTDRIHVKAAPLSVGTCQLIGRAGTGITDAYRARDPEGNLVAAYLFFNAFADSRKRERFNSMFESLEGLEHPNIVRLIDWGREGDCGSAVTEWADGMALARLLELHSRLPEANVIRYLAQIGQAMDYARKDDLACCRVSPANTLIRNDGVAKVIPFELPGNEPTTPLEVPGLLKPQFAKEMAKPENKTHWVPFHEMIFSLGTLLHEALTGLVWVRPADPPPGRRRRPTQRPMGLTDRTERVIRRATDPEPARRPASCAEFLKLLRSRPLAAGTPKPDSRPTSVAGDNRRAFVRYSLGTGSNCTINTSALDGGPRSAEIWPLVVQDVSVGGLGILLARRCEPGTELCVELLPSANREPQSFPVKVVRVRKDQYGHWMHGCAFLTPLGEAELYSLLSCLGKDGA